MIISTKRTVSIRFVICAILAACFYTVFGEGHVLGQTKPSCKNIFTNFQDLDNLNKLPGTISEEEFKRKALILRMRFSHIQRGKEIQNFIQIDELVLRYVNEMNVAFENEEIEMKKRRLLLESQATSVLELRKVEQADDGPIARLYCSFASDLAVVTYEEQQSHYYFQLGTRALQYAEGLR